MSRLLLAGTGPLLEDGVRLVSGQCLRTWHFAAPLLAAGHDVRLLTIPIPGTTHEGQDRVSTQAEFRGFAYERALLNDPGRLLPWLRAEMESFRPDAVLGINAYPAWLLARAAPAMPFWADLNGWTMAEGQVRAATVGHDRDFPHFWRMEVETLLRADRFSTVTERQAHALYGELAMLGRLSGNTFEDSFAVAVPNAVYPAYRELQRAPGNFPPAVGEQLPEDAFVALWSGGFNSWTDVETLVDALAFAFEAAPRLHLVCTGGAISGHDEDTYRLFQEASGKRLPEGRVHLLGWVDFDLVLELHRSAHVGISVDGPNTETLFGARNRLTNMMGAGLPVLTTAGTEIAGWIADRRAGQVVPQRNAEALGRALADAAAGNSPLEETGRRAREAALREFAPEATLPEFLAWAREPRTASDRRPRPEGPQSPERMRNWLLEECGHPMPRFMAEPNREGAPASPRLRPVRGLWRNIRRIIQGGPR